jgi:hypothetical protein
MKNCGLPLQTTSAEPFPFQPGPSTDDHHLERWAFEFDRYLVVRGLEDLTTAIERGAIDLELVVAERVFGDPLSMQLLEEARRLRSTARELKKLRTNVSQAESYQTGHKGS